MTAPKRGHSTYILTLKELFVIHFAQIPCRAHLPKSLCGGGPDAQPVKVYWVKVAYAISAKLWILVWDCSLFWVLWSISRQRQRRPASLADCAIMG